MSSLFVVAFVLAVPPTEHPITAGATAQAMVSSNAEFSDTAADYVDTLAAADAKSRNVAQWRRYVSATLTRTASLQRQDLEAAATEVLRVYQELPLATQLRPQEREELRQQLRSRLLQQQQKLVDQIRPNRPTVLAQQLPLGNRQPANNIGNATTGAQILDAVKSIRPNTWADNGGPGAAVLWQVGVFPGAPGNAVFGQQLGFGGVGGFGFGGAQRPADHGKELADLIQAVVAPQSWEANGGPGTIRYFAPVQAFVIRQTGETHEQLNDLLNQLRKN